MISAQLQRAEIFYSDNIIVEKAVLPDLNLFFFIFKINHEI